MKIEVKGGFAFEAVPENRCREIGEASALTHHAAVAEAVLRCDALYALLASTWVH